MVLGNAATFSAVIGRPDTAIRLMQESIDRDPVDSAKLTNLGAFLMAIDRLEEADRAFSRALALSPDDIWASQGKLILRVKQGRAAEVMSQMAPADLATVPPHLLPVIYREAGQPGDAEQALEDLRARTGGDVSHFDMATVHARLGDPDAAFEQLTLSIDKGEEDVMLAPTGSVF